MSRQVGVRKRYSDETLAHAVDMIKSKSMSLRQAASTFQIPKSTLSNKVNDKTPIGCRPGPATILTPAEEKHLADWAIHMAKIGFGRTRDELLDKVQTILKEDGRKTLSKMTSQEKTGIMHFSSVTQLFRKERHSSWQRSALL